MTENRTQNHNTLPPEFALTSETAQQLNDWVYSQGFHLWGHGTPADDSGSFFVHGVKGNEQISSFALPIMATPAETPSHTGEQITNINFMRDWPHKKYGGQPNVVLLAIPNAKPDDGTYFRLVDRYLVDFDDGDKSFPPDLIVGFFNARSALVTMNPSLSLAPDLQAYYLNVVKRRAREASERSGRQFGSVILPTTNAPAPAASDISPNKKDSPAPDIW